MKTRSLLLVAALAALIVGMTGCGRDAATATPKISKGGLDPDKAKTEQSYQVSPLK